MDVYELHDFLSHHRTLNSCVIDWFVRRSGANIGHFEQLRLDDCFHPN
jgi:hypothetical protein